MTDLDHYTAGPAYGAQVKKGEDKWTLILVRELRHSPEKVWPALIDPMQLREWAPFVVDGALDTVGKIVKLTWVGNPTPIDTTVTRVDEREVLEFGDIRWELEPSEIGTRLTLWTNIDRRFVAWGAAGWHIAFDVLDHLLSGNPIGRLAGADVMKMKAWKQLVAEYAGEFGVEPPGWAPQKT